MKLRLSTTARPKPRPTHSQGVVLVLTLIMLSLVTLMAVVFLTVSRREKTAVSVQGDLAVARLSADAALARAQAEVVSRIIAATNPYAYDFMVSSNRDKSANFLDLGRL